MAMLSSLWMRWGKRYWRQLCSCALDAPELPKFRLYGPKTHSVGRRRHLGVCGPAKMGGVLLREIQLDANGEDLGDFRRLFLVGESLILIYQLFPECFELNFFSLLS